MPDWETLQLVGVMLGVAVGPIYGILLYLIKATGCNSERVAKVETANQIYHNTDNQPNDEH